MPIAKTIKTVTAAALAGGLALAGAQAQTTTAGSDAFNLPEDISFIGNTDPNMRTATARVNGNIITGTDIDQRIALLLEGDFSQIVPEQEQAWRLQVLRNLIDETLQVQEATAQEMPIEAAEVDESYARYASEARGMTVEQLDEYLVSIGSSPRSIKRQIQGELAWERLLRRNVIPFVGVSDAEVQELVQRLEASRGTAEYRLAEIFLQANPNSREAVLANGQQIVSQLRQGASFGNYARQFSDASSAAQGGDLGWLRLEQLQNPQLETITRDMVPGQLVGPVEVPGGFSILLLINQRQIGMADPRDAVLSLKQIGIEFAPGTSPAVAEQRGAAFIQAVESMNGCGDADAKAAAIGASVLNSDNNPVNRLPEVLQNVMLNLNIGEATPPFGDLSEGIRVLMLCGRDDPAPVAAPDASVLARQIEDERVGKRAQRYLRDLRRDAVIEYN